MAECRRIGRCPAGQAVITTGGNLPAAHVIHTVGPVWRGGAKGEENLLEGAYRSSLALARDRGFKTIVFPSISTGVYGYPIERASRVAIGTVLDHLECETSLEKVIFVLFSPDDLDVYTEALEEALNTRK
jgi:O-acetyl-ADP-ribose deacetylase (regulator of RNase III)